MRILSGILFSCGVMSLYLGMGNFLFFSGGPGRTAMLVSGSLVLIAGLLFCASGGIWFRARQADLSI